MLGSEENLPTLVLHDEPADEDGTLFAEYY
jgi:hypothetical protein